MRTVDIQRGNEEGKGRGGVIDKFQHMGSRPPFLECLFLLLENTEVVGRRKEFPTFKSNRDES